MCDPALVEKCAKYIRARELIMQAVGRASMCWDPLPNKAVFQSDVAQNIGENLLNELVKLDMAERHKS